jgi:hypothetical protein
MVWRYLSGAYRANNSIRAASALVLVGSCSAQPVHTLAHRAGVQIDPAPRERADDIRGQLHAFIHAPRLPETVGGLRLLQRPGRADQSAGHVFFDHVVDGDVPRGRRHLRVLAREDVRIQLAKTRPRDIQLLFEVAWQFQHQRLAAGLIFEVRRLHHAALHDAIRGLVFLFAPYQVDLRPHQLAIGPDGRGHHLQRRRGFVLSRRRARDRVGVLTIGPNLSQQIQPHRNLVTAPRLHVAGVNHQARTGPARTQVAHLQRLLQIPSDILAAGNHPAESVRTRNLEDDLVLRRAQPRLGQSGGLLEVAILDHVGIGPRGLPTGKPSHRSQGQHERESPHLPCPLCKGL